MQGILTTVTVVWKHVVLSDMCKEWFFRLLTVSIFLLLQEKYMSEAYSEETADNEAARKLLEFGDDYRNFLDSQSDCASSLSMGRGPVNYRRRRLLVSKSYSLNIF